MAAKGLPFAQRIRDAVDKIGTVNGTKFPDPSLPPDIDSKNNDAVNEFFDQHKSVRTFFILDTIKKHVEGRHKRAKADMLLRLCIDEEKLPAGETKTFQFDNVNLTYKTNAGQSRLDRSLLLTNLMTKAEMTLEDAQAIVEASTVQGKPPLILTPATTAE